MTIPNNEPFSNDCQTELITSGPITANANNAMDQNQWTSQN